MADENVTLENTASEEQPVEPQTVESPVEATEASPEVAEAPEATAETSPSKLLAGKYKTAEELERAYQNQNAEATRMAQELAQYRRPQTETPKADTAKYTPDQLESWKEGRLIEVAQAQNAAQAAYASGDYQTAQKYEAQAKESARQIRLIDSELRKLDIQQSLGNIKKQTAESKLLSDAATVLQQYKGDLTPGTELYGKASEFLEGFQAMGMDPESALVQAQAVSMAAQVLGLGSKTVAVNTRKELTNTISQALKQGTVAGAGKASKSGSGQPDFLKMTDAEFRAYKAARGWD